MHTLELAVFEAADPDGFVDKQARLHQQLGELFAGYAGSLGLRSISEPAVFCDVVLWEDAASATAAAAALQETVELAWFPAEIAEIRVFDHFEPANGAPVLATVASAPAIEVAVLKPANPGAFAEAHTTLHDQHLEAANDVVSHTRLGLNANGLVGDINGWASPDAMETTAPKMMQVAELAAMFDPENEMMLFMPFAVNVHP